MRIKNPKSRSDLPAGPAAGPIHHLRRYALCYAVLLFVASRIFIVFCAQIEFSDIGVYYKYAAQRYALGAKGLSFFENVVFEYPPVFATIVETPLRLLHKYFVQNGQTTPQQIYSHYILLFRLMMLLFDLLIVFTLPVAARRIDPGISRLRTAIVIITYTASTGFLYHLLLDRFDIIPGALLLISTCLLMRQNWFGYLLLGFCIAIKLVPLILLPLIWAVVYQKQLAARNYARLISTLVKASALTFVGIAALVAPYYLSDGPAVFKFFDYHQARGIQIESVMASLYMLMSFGGVSLTPYYAFGSINIACPGHETLAALSPYLILLSVFAYALYIGLQAVRHPERDSVPRELLLAVSLNAAFLMIIVFSKVFSPQYLLWFLPLLCLCLAYRPFPLAAAGIWIAFLTYLIFPVFYTEQIMQLTVWGRLLVILRNISIVGLLIYFFLLTRRILNVPAISTETAKA